MSYLHNSLTILQYFRNITDLLNDFLEHRSLDSIIYNAEKAFIFKNRSKDHEILLEQFQYFRRDMSVFLEQIKTMRQILFLVHRITKKQEKVEFLEKISAHPICRKILEDMGCRTMIIGGRMTIWKRLIRQDTWRHRKLDIFFSNLSLFLKKVFASFHIPRNSEIVLHGQVQELFVEAYTNPDFGKTEPSAVDKIIEQIYDELAAEIKNMSPVSTIIINKSA
jgi:hypothetical protein